MTQTLRILGAALVAMCLAFAAAPAARAETGESYMVLYGTAGDWITGGSDVFHAEAADVQFVTSVNYDNGVSVRIDVYDDGVFQERWHTDFAAPNEVPLVEGDEFAATRWPFQAADVAGLSVSGDGRGCNTLTGEFAIRELTFAADGSIDVFSADFRQSCDGGAAMVGGVRVNSTLDNPDPNFTIDDPGDPGDPPDTTPPDAHAGLDQVGRIRGTSSDFYVEASCADDNPGAVLDSAEINGVEVSDGQRVELTTTSKARPPRYKNGKLIIKASSITLVVSCSDAAGNTAGASVMPVYAAD